MTTQTKQIYDPTAGAGGGQKDETPTTGQTVAGAKTNKSKAILSHVGYVLAAILLNPAYQSLAAAVCVAGIVIVEVLR